MQTTQWHAGPGVIRRLLDEPWQFQFGQAVYLLDRWLGRSIPFRLDRRVRFCNRVSLSFPQSEVDSITIDAGVPIGTNAELGRARQQGAIVRINVTPAVVSLLGSTGQMPFAFTRRVLATQENGRLESVRAFFDMLSQRSVDLFYQAWAQARVHYTMDAQGSDAFLPILLAIASMPPARQSKPNVPDEVAAYYAAVSRSHCVPATALQGLLVDYFGLPFEVQPFHTEWYRLQPNELTVLGRGNCTLGSITLGARQRVRGRRARVRIGPLRRADFDYFLPHAPGAQALAAFLGLFKLDSMRFDVQLVLRKPDITRLQLGCGHQLGRGYCLGRPETAGEFSYFYELAP
ncbi:type VI secretion system baseplate subunit TssG [Pseudoduganella ginsengisoli]|uniref:Type VI secretion system baseplate subunit TssG n=1 Tax=Pseudoduganella ginsengisoli TaxID=1462440 RepID=A0A6L6PWR7_9BURK|nr:type VI secretion system baseplate subunit TssG [Pseudoduganella ginsengisoli]MTW02023.1 type VI secretion system baseplate subunit TssG [Pseudoduganella ginsengisoli]